MNRVAAICGVALLLCFSARALAEESPICTDRPTKANAVCTVPRGNVQIESSLYAWSLLQATGMRSEVVTVGASAIKFGLSDTSDLQIGFTPYSELRVSQAGPESTLFGPGDILIRFKQKLSPSDAALQLGIIPFVKLPTAAKGLGNGEVEGGVALPLSFALVGPVSMTLGPELQLLADNDGHGRHIAVANVLNLSLPIAPRLTVAGEIWANFNFDPETTLKQASLDAAAAYAVSNRLQLDAGGNFGITRDTPDVEIYAGASFRF